jgi:hypothetical protein
MCPAGGQHNRDRRRHAQCHVGGRHGRRNGAQVAGERGANCRAHARPAWWYAVSFQNNLPSQIVLQSVSISTQETLGAWLLRASGRRGRRHYQL